jgi:hypothetical protein
VVDFLPKIICRSRDRPLKSEILTSRGILKLSAGKFAKSFDFPWIILRQGTLFHGKIRGKF